MKKAKMISRGNFTRLTSHHIPWKQLYVGACYYKPIFDFMQSMRHKKLRASRKLLQRKFKCTSDCICEEKVKNFMEIMGSEEFKDKLRDLSSEQIIYIRKMVESFSKKMHEDEFTIPEKIMCLSIFETSKSAYEYLRNLIPLPEHKTLNRFRKAVLFDAGVTPAMINRLQGVSKTMKESDKVVALIFGSIDINPFLFYNSKLDKIIGFEDWGNDFRGGSIVDSAFVFAIRGIETDLFLPVAYSFYDAWPKTSKLARLFKEVVKCITFAGFKIVASICEDNYEELLEKLRSETLQKRGPDTTDNSGTILVHGVEIVPLFNSCDLLLDLRNNMVSRDLEFFVNSKDRPANWDRERELLITKNNKALKASWSHIELVYRKDSINDESTRKLPALTFANVFIQILEKAELDSVFSIFNGKVASVLDKLSLENGDSVDEIQIPPEGYFTSYILIFLEKLSEALCGGKREKDPKYELKTLLTDDSFHHEFFEIAKTHLRHMRFVNRTTQEPIHEITCLKKLITTIIGFQVLWKKLKEIDIQFIKTGSFTLEPLDRFFSKNCDTTCINFARNFKNFCYPDITS